MRSCSLSASGSSTRTFILPFELFEANDRQASLQIVNEPGPVPRAIKADAIKLETDASQVLGIEVSSRTIRRLVLAGFMRGSCAGSAVEVETESLLAHIKATRVKASFWSERRDN
ncbi:MAG TPA: hypothetical protein VIS99_03685 [Terrimicrobiaceae bacterium]